MECEGSLMCSQEPSTGLYSEPDQRHAYHPIKIHFNSIHSHVGLTSGIFPSGFPTNILHVFSTSSVVLHALPIYTELN
jgi:hypothetical protein